MKKSSKIFFGGGAIAVLASLLGALSDVGKVSKSVNRLSTLNDSARAVRSSEKTTDLSLETVKPKSALDSVKAGKDIYSTVDNLNKAANSKSCEKKEGEY